MVNKTRVMLYATIHAAVQIYDLIGIKKCPSRLRDWFPFFGTESSVISSLDEFGQRSIQNRLPSSGTAFEGLSSPVGHQFDLGLPPIANLERCPQEGGLFGSHVRNGRFFFAQGQLKVIAEKHFNFLFNLLLKGMVPANSNEPVIGIPEIPDPNSIRVRYHS